MKLAQKFSEQVRVQWLLDHRPGEIQFHPVASVQNHGFAVVACDQFIQRTVDAVIRKRELLADLDRGCAEIAADHAEIHGEPPAGSGCDVTNVPSNKINTAMVRIANRRFEACAAKRM